MTHNEAKNESQDPMDILIGYQRELVQKAEKFKDEWGDDPVLIFRGQSDESWGLKSSAKRRLESQDNPVSMIDYLDEHLIKPAQTEGYGHREGKSMNSLELLAALQHQGAATCLIDFTANFHIALWFACQGGGKNDNNDKDGKLFIINRGDTSKFREIGPEQAKQESMAKILEAPSIKSDSITETNTYIYYWEPPANENRIIAQHSCFIFTNETNELINENLYGEITVKKEDKEEIISSLKKYYGLNYQNIFRDFTGFASSRGLGKPIKAMTNQELFSTAREHYQREEYREAIDYCTRFIKEASEKAGTDPSSLLTSPVAPEFLKYQTMAKGTCSEVPKVKADKSYVIRAYFMRGCANKELNKHTEAIKDFDEIIQLNPDNSTAYLRRAFSKGRLNHHKEAIEDYNESIRLNPDNSTAYLRRAFSKGQLNHHKEAIEDCNESIRLNPGDTRAYLVRGIIADKSNLPEDGRRDLKKALDLATQENNQPRIELIRKYLGNMDLRHKGTSELTRSRHQ